jgi:GTP-binding protein
MIKIGDPIHSLDVDGKVASKGKITKLFKRRGLEQISIEQAEAGDIITLCGIDGSTVNHTLCSPSVSVPLKHIPIDEPTIAMQFYVNDSPIAGEDGKMLTSQVIRDRLEREIETNVALQVTFSEDSFEVSSIVSYIFNRSRAEASFRWESLLKQ